MKISGSSPWSCKTRSGDSCILPFTHDGKEYMTCSLAGSDYAWCPIETDYSYGGQWNKWSPAGGKYGYGWDWCYADKSHKDTPLKCEYGKKHKVSLNNH